MSDSPKRWLGEALQQSHSQHTSAGVAEELSVPVTQVVKTMIVQRSTRGPGEGESHPLR